MRRNCGASLGATSVAAIAFAGTSMPTHAATHIDVGANNLLANTPNQVITLQVTNDAGTTPPQVTDFAGYFQIGPNALDQTVPVFQGADFTNTFWGAGSAGGVGPEPGLPQLMQNGFSLDAGSVAADGNLINLVIDTTGISSGTFDLKLTNNAYTDVFGQSSTFLPAAANSAITIHNGSITIAAGPTNHYWDVNGTTAGEAAAPRPPEAGTGSRRTLTATRPAAAGGTLTAVPAATDNVIFAAGTDATRDVHRHRLGHAARRQVKSRKGTSRSPAARSPSGAFDVAAGAAASVASTVAARRPAAADEDRPGTLTLTAANTYAGGTTVTAGTLVLANADATGGGSINVADGALAQAQAGLPKAVTVTTLATNASGKFDLTNNSMVVKGMTVAQVEALVEGGYNAGHWNGADGHGQLDRRGRRARHHRDRRRQRRASCNKTSFKGVDGLTGTDVLVKYTYYGDSDLSARDDAGRLHAVPRRLPERRRRPGSRATTTTAAW